VIGKRLRDGLWCMAEGAVYDEFDYKTHVRERDRGDFKNFIAGVDEGYTNPAVILVIGLDGDDRAHVFEEFYERNVVQTDFVRRAKSLADHWQIGTFHVDPSAAGLIAEMRQAGLSVVKANNAVFDGIQNVKGRLKVQGDGLPRLTVEPGCTNLIAEFESYAWKGSKIGLKDEPAKENDHAMDALRYALMRKSSSVHVVTNPFYG